MTSFPYRTPASRPPEAIVPLPGAATRLGPLRKTYAPGPLWRVVLFPAVFAVLIFVVLLGSSGAVGGIATLVPLGLMVFGFAAAAFLVTAWGPIRRRDLRIDLHEGGLVTRWRGARDVVIFEDVGEVWFDIERSFNGPVRTTGLRLVELSGGTYQVSGHVEDAAGLLNAVLRRCSELLVAEARTALREGEMLTFGNVRIDRDGITIGSARAAWSELRLVRLEPGKALFLRRSTLFPWGTVKHETIPHPTVFLRLVSELAPRVKSDEPGVALLK